MVETIVPFGCLCRRLNPHCKRYALFTVDYLLLPLENHHGDPKRSQHKRGDGEGLSMRKPFHQKEEENWVCRSNIPLQHGATTTITNIRGGKWRHTYYSRKRRNEKEDLEETRATHKSKQRGKEMPNVKKKCEETKYKSKEFKMKRWLVKLHFPP